MLNRMLARWAKDNQLGKGRNALRAVGCFVLAGALCGATMWLVGSPAVQGMLGMRGAAAVALVPGVLSLAALAGCAMALSMSASKLMSGGKLG